MNINNKLIKRKILIGMLLRDNEKSIQYQLDIFKNIENLEGILIEYIFLENGSKDNTPIIIRNFMNTRDGLIITVGNTLELDKLDRISRISQLRNKIKEQVINKDFEYMVILDSDIFFGADIIEKLVNKMDVDSKIGVACAYGIAYLPAENGIETNNHYYDTSALIMEKNESSYYPRCVFKGCVECRIDKYDPANCQSFEVFSAFGGLALYRKEVIKNPNIFWSPVAFNNSPVSEHVGFFMQMHEYTKYTTTINSDCLVFWDVSTLKI